MSVILHWIAPDPGAPARCLACRRVYWRVAPGRLFCPGCVWQLDTLTALIAAACSEAQRRPDPAPLGEGLAA